MKNKIFRLPLLLLFIAFIGCDKEEVLTDTEAVETVQSSIPSHIKNKIEKLGFKVDENSSVTENIVLDGISFGKGYTIEGDVLILESEIDQMIADLENRDSDRHYTTNSLVSVSTQRTIKIYRSNNFPTNVKNALNAAVNRYNALNLKLRFQVTGTRSGSNIEMYYDNNFRGTGIFAAAQFPSGGNPGRLLRLNPDFYARTNLPGNTVSVLAHEIGHAIGFRHMDYRTRESCPNRANEGTGPGANVVPNTGTDAITNGSWMLACIGVNTNRPFKLVDKIALSNVYGKNRSRGTTFLRYRRRGGGYFYTGNYNEVKEGNSTFIAEGIQCRIYTSNSSSRKPLYRYLNPNIPDYFYTSNFNELNGTRGALGYRYEGIAGYIYGSNASGRVPIYRYVNNGKGFHFYTTNFGELGNGGNGFTFEGIIGYTYPN